MYAFPCFLSHSSSSHSFIVLYEQLQLTYRPEEVLAIEDAKPSDEEQEPPVPVDNNVVVSDSEPAPPPPPPSSHNNFETGDLLVGFWIPKLSVIFCMIYFPYAVLVAGIE